jgi:hypothetical protein
MNKDIRKQIEIKFTPMGVSIWIYDRWVMDASDFFNDGMVTISTNRMKQVHNNLLPDDLMFKFVPDKTDLEDP